MAKGFLLPLLTAFFLLTISCKSKKGEFVCTPCDLECDELIFTEPGKCPHCGMDLINISELESEKQLVVNEISVHEGSGSFLMEGGHGNVDKPITVFYHRPKTLNTDSRVLLVVPGAGRNGDSYRDAWIEEAEAHGVLILSPQYPEKYYPFGAYHLGGLINESNMAEKVTFVEGSNIARLNEEGLVFEINTDVANWIFNDFDRIFDAVKAELGLSATKYDMFGHSAGGHILHRMALLYPDSKADRMYAGNASFYTLPDFEVPYPFGLGNTPLTEEDLQKAFGQNLIVFLGELDNENENGGTFLRSKTADEQGLHRLERGTYFFDKAKAMASQLNCDFNWQLLIVPNVGHDHKSMGEAAGKYLYAGR